MAEQTHKTIIFEEFDDTKANLFTILDNDPSDDELIHELKDKLTVHTFQEFLKKFAPKVYGVSKNADGKFVFLYTTNPQEYKDDNVTEEHIEDNIYFQMLERLYESKGKSGESNLTFDDSEIIEMLTPKKELAEIRNIRQKKEYLVKRYYEAEADGDTSTMKDCEEKILECREIISTYMDPSSILKLIPIIIEDTKTKLTAFNTISNAGKNEDDSKETLSLPVGRLKLDAAGNLVIDTEKIVPQIAAPSEEKKAEGALVEVKDNLPAEVKTVAPQETKKIPDTQDIIVQTIKQDYEEVAPEKNEAVLDLILSTFVPTATVKTSEKVDKTVLEQRLKIFEDAYIGSRQSFINTMSKIIESLLGVKTFFDHATAEGGAYSPIPEGVIIANCKASRLLTIKDKLSYYMKKLGKDGGSELRIWFALLPNVLESPPESINKAPTEDGGIIGGSLRKKRQAESKKTSDEYVSINALKEFLEIMDAAKIMTVFNIRKKKGNTFSDLSVNEVKDKMKVLDSCNYAHAVYAYPNFTLIRGKETLIFDDRPDSKMTLPGIYIDAAYPAAGLLVASQQHAVLKSNGLTDYDKDSVCVGVDFENVDVKKAFQTKFNRESLLSRSEDLVKTINENMFGFAFSSDKVRDESGNIWKNSYIHCARTLAKNSKTRLYKPVYQTLIEDFIAQDLKSLASKKKADVKKRIAAINSYWKMKQKRFPDLVNFLLRDGESIEVEDKSGKLKIHINFVGGDGYVDFEVEGE